MAAKATLISCVLSVLTKSVLSQCIGRDAAYIAGLPSPLGWPYEGPYDSFGYGPLDMPYGQAWAPAGFGAAFGFEPAASYGGGLAVTSASPIAPTGLTVTSENAIEGVVAVSGQLPFLGAVATDGVFQTAGAGAVSYGCGDGAVGIVAEAPIAPAAYGYGPAVPQYGYSPVIGGYNGCGNFY